MKLTFILAASALIFASHASAQSLSVADLQAKIDAEMSKDNEYAALLNDPDTVRAQMAMEMMLESGDDALVKIALEYGLYSPDGVVRNAAIKGFLDTLPRLELQFDGKKADQQNLASVMDRRYSLVPNSEGYTATTIDIESFDSANNCYPVRQFQTGCFLRFVGETIQYRSTDEKWYEVEYMDAGALTVISFQSDGRHSVVVQTTIPLH